MFFTRRKFILFTDEEWFSWVGTLIVKTVKYGVLRIQVHCMEILWNCPKLVFGVQCLENDLQDRFSFNIQLLQKLSTYFDSTYCSTRGDWIGSLVSARWSEKPYCKNKNSFLPGLLRIVRRELRPPRSRDLTTLGIFLWGFLKENFYSNNPRSMEDLE